MPSSLPLKKRRKNLPLLKGDKGGLLSRQLFPVVFSNYVFLRRSDEIVLVHRANTGYRDNMYGLPAGHVEAGEGGIAAPIPGTLEKTSSLAKPNCTLLKKAHPPVCISHSFSMKAEN